MRNAFASYLCEIGNKDKELMLLVGDIGFRIFDAFRDKYENQFLNCGIAEQNMISVAAGMASQGKHPIVYTIIPFLVMRAFEQIRVDIGINNVGVMLVGVGGGLAYDKLGSTHHAYEDITLMRSIPNMHVYTPFDPASTVLCTEHAYINLKNKESSYIRLSKGGEPEIYVQEMIDSFIFLLKGTLDSQNIIITHGAITKNVLDIINNSQKDCCLLSITCFDKNVIEKLLQIIKTRKIEVNFVVIEENFRIGGLFEFLSSEMIKMSLFRKIKYKVLPHKYIFEIFDRNNLLELSGFTKKNIDHLLI